MLSGRPLLCNYHWWGMAGITWGPKAVDCVPNQEVVSHEESPNVWQINSFLNFKCKIYTSIKFYTYTDITFVGVCAKVYNTMTYIGQIIAHKVLVKCSCREETIWHYIDVIMITMVGVSNHQPLGCLLIYSGADQRKHQSSASLAFAREINRDRWIPRTKGQLRGKCFHLMTSPWVRLNQCHHNVR